MIRTVQESHNGQKGQHMVVISLILKRTMVRYLMDPPTIIVQIMVITPYVNSSHYVLPLSHS